MTTKTKDPKAKTATSKAGVARQQSTKINKYIAALQAAKPKRGRRRTPESIREKIGSLEAQIATSSGVARVKLIQEKIDNQKLLEEVSSVVDITELQGEFVAVAAEYSASQGITYAAWRELGIPTDVLTEANVPRR